MLIRLIGFPVLAVCAVFGLGFNNWLPMAFLVIAVVILTVILDALGIHPQRSTRTGGRTVK